MRRDDRDRELGTWRTKRERYPRPTDLTTITSSGALYLPRDAPAVATGAFLRRAHLEHRTSGVFKFVADHRARSEPGVVVGLASLPRVSEWSIASLRGFRFTKGGREDYDVYESHLLAAQHVFRSRS